MSTDVFTGIREERSAWGAVLGLTLCVAALIASEFMPVSLLTPIARDLALTEGQAGQAISVSGFFAVCTSLFVSVATGKVDRRNVLVGFTALMILSGGMVALAPNYTVLMIGRALLGITIGGFWSMSTATVMRLVPEQSVPKALAMLQGGTALASTVAAPLGSYVGDIAGWRAAFFSVVPLALAALVIMLWTLPSLPVRSNGATMNVFRLLRRRQVALGMTGITLFFMGQFALFTYLRPYLEVVTRGDISALSIMLLVVGLSGLVGLAAVGPILKRGIFRALIAAPLLLGVVALALIFTGQNVAWTAALLAVWGFVSMPAPVAWGTWLTKTLPDDAEAGGGLMVAAVQVSITAGAALGGILFDFGGHATAFSASFLILAAGSMVAILTWRSSTGNGKNAKSA